MRKSVTTFLGATLLVVGLAGCGANDTNNFDTQNDGDVKILNQRNQDNRDNNRGYDKRNINTFENRNGNNNGRSGIMNNGNRTNNRGPNCDDVNRGRTGVGTYGTGATGTNNEGTSGAGGMGYSKGPGYFINGVDGCGNQTGTNGTGLGSGNR